MITGRQVLNSVDQALNAARGKVDSVENQIEKLNRKRLDNQKARTEGFKELARIRLGMLADRGVIQHLDEVEKQVMTLLDQRQQALEKLIRQIQDSEKVLRDAEFERQHQVEQLEAAASVVDSTEARTQKRLDAEPDYQQQRDKTGAAENKAQHALEKAARSDEEYQTKGHSYQHDVLFMYLWGRQFSLPAYHANPLIRWLDEKVARLIGYADARANYSRLGEIPVRLHEHANALEAIALEEFKLLKELDTKAREADGIPGLEKKMAEEQSSLDAIDEDIEQKYSDLKEFTNLREKYSTGDDEFSSKAIQYLSTEYQRDDLMELRRETLTTPFPDDDMIVSRLITHEKNQRELETSMQILREMIRQNQKQLNELEALRADFKRGQFDRPGSTFSDKAMIAMMLGQFMNGMMDRRNLWKALQELQHYRPQYSDPTFGSGGFGRGTVWNGGLGGLKRGRGGFGGSIGRGGLSGRSGGGFRTGGGF